MSENYFVDLNSVNVNKHTEKKNGLTYLSWAWAWGEVKKRHPDASYTVYEDGNGCIYWTDGRTCWVKTGVTINGIEHIEYLPVMDFKNRSIPLEQITSYDVNKAIQRSLTKACARHGLGLYIYAGEDLPEEEQDNKPEEEQDNKPEADERAIRNYLSVISKLLAETNTDGAQMLEWVNEKFKTNAQAFKDLDAQQLVYTMEKLRQKKEKQ